MTKGSQVKAHSLVIEVLRRPFLLLSHVVPLLLLLLLRELLQRVPESLLREGEPHRSLHSLRLVTRPASAARVWREMEEVRGNSWTVWSTVELNCETVINFV